ncbi:MAG: DUF1800 domain-containing protein [Solirubrobacteraceae bacterium]
MKHKRERVKHHDAGKHHAVGTVKPKARRHRLHRPPAASGGGPSGNPVGGTPSGVLTQAMVDRLFWRAGFGPTATDRATWTGQPVSAAVDWLLKTPAGSTGAPGSNSGKALDPTGDDTDLVLSWVDLMVRATNPLVERMTFFWHRHWANSRDQVSPPQLMIRQNGLFRKYADLGTNPGVTFHQMANEVTVDCSMLRYLTGESNVKGAPNENYARELMELFTLGVTNASGQPNYKQMDVEQIAKALSGWHINDTDPNNATSYFFQGDWYDGPKEVFGQFGNFTNTDVVNLVLSHAAHPAFLVNKLWSEFIVTPLDATTLQSLTQTYTSSGLQLGPLLKAILNHPALFDSLDQPNMIKPPVIYVVGVMRALGVGITDSTAADYLDAMGQTPYFPPNVSGWEGGLSWLNTNTALARFSFAASLVAGSKPADVAGETGRAAYERAYAAVGQPWLAAGTQTLLQSFAAAAPASTATRRIQRQVALRALILAGPDAQVM